MAGVSGLLILISVITGTASFIALIRPLPGLWLPTRKRAAIAWVASFVLLFIGAALSPNPKPEELAPPTEVALRSHRSRGQPRRRSRCDEYWKQ